MLIFLSLFFILFPTASFSSCKFKSHVSGVYSFSGVTSIALKELGLLKNPIVKGISVFNPISKADFVGKRFPGGIFLSRDVLSEFGGSVVFYDESRELSNILNPMSSVQGWEIKTRGLVPTAVTDYVLGELDPFIENCEREKEAFRHKTQNLSAKILSSIPPHRTMVFYLGDYQNGHPPELLMVQDGIVKWLIENKKIKSYPSPLAYVNWSVKIMRSLPAGTLHIAVKDSGAEMLKSVVKSTDHWTLTYPGSLVPGLSQLDAWDYLEKKINP